MAEALFRVLVVMIGAIAMGLGVAYYLQRCTRQRRNRPSTAPLMTEAELRGIPLSLLLRDVIAHGCDRFDQDQLCVRCRDKWNEIDRRQPLVEKPSDLEAAAGLLARLQTFVRVTVTPAFPQLLRDVSKRLDTLEPILKEAVAELTERFRALHITLVWDDDYGLGLRVATPLTAEEVGPLRRAFMAWQEAKQVSDQFWMGISFE